MFGRKFMNFGWCRDKYTLCLRGCCRDCPQFEVWKGEGYCNYWKKNVSGSDSCEKFGN